MRLYEIKVDFYYNEFFPQKHEGHALTRGRINFESARMFWRDYWGIDGTKMPYVPIPLLVEAGSKQPYEKGYFIVDKGEIKEEDIDEYEDSLVDMSDRY